MEQERQVTIVDEDKAYGVWKEILRDYEGTFSEDNIWRYKGYKFSGKTAGGANFEITLHFMDTWASVGAEVRGTKDGEPTYGGTGTPCYNSDDVRRALMEAVGFCKVPKKEYEQLTLW